jgi:hypothetical protein
MVLLLLILGLGGADFYVLAAFWQLEMVQFFGPDAYHVARILTPFGIAFLAGIFFTGWAIDLTRGRIREIFLINACLMTAGIGGMLALGITSANLSMALSFIGMWGVGALFIPPIIVLTTLVPETLIGTIVGFAMSFRLIVGQAGYTLFFNLVQPQLVIKLPTLLQKAVIKAGLPGNEIINFIEFYTSANLTGLATVKGITPAVLAAVDGATSQAFLEVFPLVYYCGIGIGVGAIIACALLPSIRKYLTDRVVVDIH